MNFGNYKPKSNRKDVILVVDHGTVLTGLGRVCWLSVTSKIAIIFENSKLAGILQ